MMEHTLDWISADAKVLKAGNTPILLRGMGLGGWLLPEGYMWRIPKSIDRPRTIEKLILDLCGTDYAQRFWSHYHELFMSEDDIRFIKDNGFNSIRLPFNARTLFIVDEQGISFYDPIIKLIDKCIHWCRIHGIYVILDMHGAPGGQTGANIDDSEHDQPQLFQEEHFQSQCVTMWRMLAMRYAHEPTIAGYDLLNEPLPEWFSQYNTEVMPLYRRIRDAIREVDTRHMLILEGTHWATDWTIFDELAIDPYDSNYMLEFHKYWNNPDEESIVKFLNYRNLLEVPIFMGEGGENNLWWYTVLFPLLEELNISWNFWTYKKMDGPNSVVSFDRPKNWDMLEHLIDHQEMVSPLVAIEIFDGFLESLQQVRHPSSNTSYYQHAVIHSLKRQPPLEIPAEGFCAAHITEEKAAGAEFRIGEKATIAFRDGHEGPVDFCRQGGEPQPEDQLLCVQLHAGEWLEYLVTCEKSSSYALSIVVKNIHPSNVAVALDGLGIMETEIVGTSGYHEHAMGNIRMAAGKHRLRIKNIGSDISLHLISLKKERNRE
jgi:endoglucanase